MITPNKVFGFFVVWLSPLAYVTVAGAPTKVCLTESICSTPTTLATLWAVAFPVVLVFKFVPALAARARVHERHFTVIPLWLVLPGDLHHHRRALLPMLPIAKLAGHQTLYACIHIRACARTHTFTNSIAQS
jgi:hypothetical protein